MCFGNFSRIGRGTTVYLFKVRWGWLGRRILRSPRGERDRRVDELAQGVRNS